MKKDVIYIDVEDDITTIVGKIKSSKEKIVAVVPPARYGVFQSAVNMRLLKRAADTAKKHLVIISNSSALAALAASANIPVAKNLQTKPEIAEIPVLKVDDNDVIDGNDLPIGDIASATKSKSASDRAVDDVIATSATTSTSGDAAKKPVRGKKSEPKVPNFSTFRKRLFVFGGLGVLLVGFLVWAIWFAPKATVIITAKNTPVTVDSNVQLAVDGVTDFKASTIKSIFQEQTADVSVEFSATGKKKVGEKAKGTVRIKTDATTILMTGLTVPAGTQIQSSGGSIYLTGADVVFPQGSPSALAGIVVAVTAANVGEEYNGATGSASTSANGVTSVAFVTSPSGGSSREVTVVSEDDLAKATAALGEKKVPDLRSKLESSFSESNVVIKETFQEKRGDPVPSVKINEEATGPVTLKSTVTASMMAVERSEIQKFLKTGIQSEIEGMKSQKIYSDGSSDVKFSQFVNDAEKPKIRLTANGKIGPVIKEDEVKEQSLGKNYGEIQLALEAIDGVEDVDIKFWPFWVRTVPNDVDRITVEFKIKDGS